MKHKTLNRLLLLGLIAVMVLSLAACKKEPSESAPVDASISDSSSSTPESEPEVEDPLERLSLSDKVATGVKRNADTVGWLTIPNTTIDAAVLQAKDNVYYERLTEDKKYDVFGCYYMDYESKQGTSAELSKQNIIYGHSDYKDNKDGPKFSQLFNYLDIEFVRNNPYIFYTTRDEEMVFQVFAVAKANVDPTNPGFYYYLDADPATDKFLAMVDEAKKRSEYIIDMPVSGTDKLLTLSTCLADRDSRLIIMAKLLPADKQLPKTMEVEVNPSPKRS